MPRDDYAETGGGMQSHAAADRATGAGARMQRFAPPGSQRMSPSFGFRPVGATLALVPLAAVNIPIDFGRPTERDFDEFAKALSGFAGRKVLVHCQVNMRASTMVFLYRNIVAKWDPHRAYGAVSKVGGHEGP